MKSKTVRVVAREAFPYDGVNRSIGESFEAPAEDARILTLVGRVEQAPKASPPQAEHDSEEVATPYRRGRSRRQDMVPED